MEEWRNGGVGVLDRLSPDAPAALIAAACLFNPGLQSANTFDFHSQTLAGTFLLFAFHYLLGRRLWPFVFFAALASACKEEIVLIVAMMGLYMLVVERRVRGDPRLRGGRRVFPPRHARRDPGIQRWRRERARLRAIRRGRRLHGRSFMTALTDPRTVLGETLSWDKVLYLTHLVGLVGVLGLLSPAALLIASPPVFRGRKYLIKAALKVKRRLNTPFRRVERRDLFAPAIRDSTIRGFSLPHERGPV